jgi:hypothetical protein
MRVRVSRKMCSERGWLHWGSGLPTDRRKVCMFIQKRPSIHINLYIYMFTSYIYLYKSIYLYMFISTYFRRIWKYQIYINKYKLSIDFLIEFIHTFTVFFFYHDSLYSNRFSHSLGRSAGFDWSKFE